MRQPTANLLKTGALLLVVAIALAMSGRCENCHPSPTVSPEHPPQSRG